MITRASILESIGDCTEDMFRCNNGSCLNRTRICDFTKDCADGEDETFDCGTYILNSSFCVFLNIETHDVRILHRMWKFKCKLFYPVFEI